MTATDLTETATAGFNGEPNKQLSTSPTYYAHALGAYLRASGRTTPRDVAMSRGYSIRANGMRFAIHESKPARGQLTTTFERLE